jgi:hypothetical protein
MNLVALVAPLALVVLLAQVMTEAQPAATIPTVLTTVRFSFSLPHPALSRSERDKSTRGHVMSEKYLV